MRGRWKLVSMRVDDAEGEARLDEEIGLAAKHSVGATASAVPSARCSSVRTVVVPTATTRRPSPRAAAMRRHAAPVDGEAFGVQAARRRAAPRRKRAERPQPDVQA